MTRFSIDTDIPAPPERVWDVMSDIVRWHEWTASVTSIKRIDEGPLVVGSRALIRQPRFPPALWRVTAIEPGTGFTWTSTAPGLRVVGRHFVEPRSGMSRATLSVEYHGMFGALMARLAGDITQKYLSLEAAGLKARSEGER